jgi:hypothetical protein
LAHHLLDSIALLRVEATQLILDVEACLTTEVEQVFALDPQFARQRIDTNLLFLQAVLLCRQPRAHAA